MPSVMILFHDVFIMEGLSAVYWTLGKANEGLG